MSFCLFWPRGQSIVKNWHFPHFSINFLVQKPTIYRNSNYLFVLSIKACPQKQDTLAKLREFFLTSLTVQNGPKLKIRFVNFSVDLISAYSSYFCKWKIKSKKVIPSKIGPGKFFTYVTKTRPNLPIYSRKPENYNGTIIFKIDIIKNSSPLILRLPLNANQITLISI